MGMPFQRQKHLKPPENLLESTCFPECNNVFVGGAHETGDEAGQGHDLWV